MFACITFTGAQVLLCRPLPHARIDFSMGDEKWRNYLDPSLPDAVTLLSNLVNGPLLDRLLSRKLLTDDHYGKIYRTRRYLGKKDAARRLIQILKLQPAPSYDTFCDILLRVDGGRGLYNLLKGDRLAAHDSDADQRVVPGLATRPSSSPYIGQSFCGLPESSFTATAGSSVSLAIMPHPVAQFPEQLARLGSETRKRMLSARFKRVQGQSPESIRRVAVKAARFDGENSVSELSQEDESISVGWSDMDLMFRKWKIFDAFVGPSGGVISSNNCSTTISIPPGALDRTLTIGFAQYTFLQEKSTGLKDGVVISDLLSFHPCGTVFKKDVTVNFSRLGCPRNPGQCDLALLYQPSSSDTFDRVATVNKPDIAVPAIGPRMSVCLNESMIELKMRQFCKICSIETGCEGHMYRVLAFEYNFQAHSLRRSFDLAISFARDEFLSYALKEMMSDHRPRPIRASVYLYFNKDEDNRLVIKPSPGWQHEDPDSRSITLDEDPLRRAQEKSECFLSFGGLTFRRSLDGNGDSDLNVVVSSGGKTLFQVPFLNNQAPTTISPSTGSFNQERKPTENELMSLSKKLVAGGEWKFIGRHLGLEDTVIGQIEESYGVAREKAYQMLKYWIQLKGNAATVAVLKKVLEKEDLNEIAEIIFQ